MGGLLELIAGLRLRVIDCSTWVAQAWISMVPASTQRKPQKQSEGLSLLVIARLVVVLRLLVDLF